jgi:hypothetical protein
MGQGAFPHVSSKAYLKSVVAADGSEGDIMELGRSVDRLSNS